MIFRAWLLFIEEVVKEAQKMTGDLDYITKAKEGDQDALNFLIKKWHPRLVSIFTRLNPRLGTLADDLAQDTLMKVIRNIHALRDVKSFEAWITKIARHQLYTFYRKSPGYHAPLTPDVGDLAPTGRSMGRLGSEFVSPREAEEADTTFQDLIRQEDTARLHKAIEKLPSKYQDKSHGEKSRDILIDATLRGRRLKEIADDYGVPLGTVKRIIHVAKAKLLELLSVRSEI